MVEYYSQRASGGELIVTEATAIAPSARGYYHAPGLCTKEQEAGIEASRMRFTPEGGYMFAQAFWHAGRTTHVAITGTEPVTASVDPAYAARHHMFWSIRRRDFCRRRHTGRWRRPRSRLCSRNTARLRCTPRRRASTGSRSWPPTAI